MPGQTTDAILADLRRLPLLTAAVLARVESTIRYGEFTPERLARWLTEAGWLTRYQADVLLAGQAERLVFGPYVLLEEIGEGGMGRVFKARHVRLGRIDALKVIRADKVASKIIARRFLREIRLTSRLHHPHIVRAYDAGQVGPLLYLATEYVAGKDLATTVRKTGPLSTAEACLAVYQTANALQHIHEQGLVHRDLKPSNLIRDSATGAVKILDLGLSGFHRQAGEASEAGTLTRDGVLLGTPDYMAPEQVQNPHDVDIRADLYSLGGTLYFLLTGNPPFEGTQVEKLYKHAVSPPPPLVIPGRPTPPALAEIVARLMAKRPEDRYPTPQALTAALLALRPGTTPTVESAPVDTPEDPAAELWREQFEQLVNRETSMHEVPALVHARSGRQAVWWIAGSVLVLLLLGGIVAAIVARPRNAPTASTAPGTAPTPPTVAPDPVTEELNALRRAVANPAEDRAALRRRVLDFRTRYPHGPSGIAAAGLLRRLPGPLDQLSLTPDATGLPIVQLREGETAAGSLAFTPDDERLVVAYAGSALVEWDPVGQVIATRRRLDVGMGMVPALTPDGRVAVVVDPMGRLLVGVGTASPRSLDLGSGLSVRVVGVSADGKTAAVAFTDPNEQLGVVNLETGALSGRLEQRSVGVTFLALSPDGGTVAVIGEDDEARVFTIASGKESQRHGVETRWRVAATATFGPDGQRLYLSSVRFGMAARYPLGGVGREVYLVEESDRATCLAVSADEVTVAVGTYRGDVLVFGAGTGGRPVQQLRLGVRVRAVTHSTNGRVIAAALDDGRVVLVPLKS